MPGRSSSDTHEVCPKARRRRYNNQLLNDSTGLPWKCGSRCCVEISWGREKKTSIDMLDTYTITVPLNGFCSNTSISALLSLTTRKSWEQSSALYWDLALRVSKVNNAVVHCQWPLILRVETRKLDVYWQCKEDFISWRYRSRWICMTRIVLPYLV